MMAEVFTQTNDGKYAALRWRGELHYGVSPDELAAKHGITEYVLEIDVEAAKRYEKAHGGPKVYVRSEAPGWPYSD
jgi:hypothetical protein